jgi:hypothetical protein
MLCTGQMVSHSKLMRIQFHVFWLIKHMATELSNFFQILTLIIFTVSIYIYVGKFRPSVYLIYLHIGILLDQHSDILAS